VLNIRGEDEAQVRAYLSSTSVQETLVDLVSFGKGSGLRLSDVYLKKQGVVSDTATLIQMARKAAGISNRLCVTNEPMESVANVVSPVHADSFDLVVDEIHNQEYELTPESEPNVWNIELEQQETTVALDEPKTERPASQSDWKRVSLLLADRNTRRSERRKIANGLVGNVITLSLVIKRTTSDLDTVDAQTGVRGAFVYGTENGVDIELRVAPKDVDTVVELKSGDSIEATGVIVDWDQFYGRLKVEYRP
jgi:hypothetical protein